MKLISERFKSLKLLIIVCPIVGYMPIILWLLIRVRALILKYLLLISFYYVINDIIMLFIYTLMK